VFFLYKIGPLTKFCETGISFPFVSIIICVKNAEGTIRECLNSVLGQDYNDFEVIVMDDYSDDNSRLILQDISSQSKKVSVYEPSRNVIGKKVAIKEAVNKAKGEWILMIDADCVALSSHWIQTMVKSRKQGDDIVLGYGAYAADHTFLNTFIRYETYYIALQYFSAARQKMAYMGVGRNMAFRKESFLNSKLFEGTQKHPFGDDDQIVNALRHNNNISICLDPASYTVSIPKNSFTDYFKQKRRHIVPAHLYSKPIKFLLVILGGTHIAFFLLVFCYAYKGNFKIAISLLLLRWILILLISMILTKRIEEKGIIKWIPIVDFTLAMTYLAQVLCLPFQKKNW